MDNPIDGASNGVGGRANVVLESMEGLATEHALRFGFKASNNVAKYEVVLVDIYLARFVRAKKFHIKSNFASVMWQYVGELEAKKESMKKY